jgi:hypothetical protein
MSVVMKTYQYWKALETGARNNTEEKFWRESGNHEPMRPGSVKIIGKCEAQR